ncbi:MULTISPECIES: MATE family efflux transporter [unclassified Solwaraspora]|uniref:MATE family efflux transporter n=1 Tax=unclassified Solwaraspora TaxID=2627926 RepID=UPI00259B5B72|nr:MATE family efflux transporter [Solwaraspora sp. WMMA2056]WJK39925.1 MATE family efflux transporter [Solwaraspora sp. WMMA2056]
MTSARGPGTAPRQVSHRRIAHLALPALVVLAAEPLYVLVDTAVVGRLGATALAAVAVGGTVMSVAAWLGTVAAYGTTGRAARRFGAGDASAAQAEGVQASWLAFAVGVALAVAAQFAAGPVTAGLAGPGSPVADAAAQWLRIAAWGAPGLLLAAAGNGWMRGVQDTRRPLRYVLVANGISAVLCPLLVYPAGLGLVGSAVANVVAQTLGGALFVRALIRTGVPLRPRPQHLLTHLAVGRDLLIRGAAFQASFLSATAVAARYGTAPVAAHQIAIQLWFFTALAMDALAIAGQSLIGAALGAGDAVGARLLARRLVWLGAGAGVVFAAVFTLGAPVVPGWFSPDPAVHDQAMLVWPWFVALQPVAGVVFALDGVFIGAGDLRYLRNLTIGAALGGFLPAIWASYALQLGLAGIWAGLGLFMLVRLVGLVARLRSPRWAVLGVPVDRT